MAEEPIKYSREWYASRTPEQLQMLLHQSQPGSKAFEGAVDEIDRRSAEEREAAMKRIAVWTMWAAIIAAVASVASLLN